MKIKYECLLCGRHNFDNPSPHNCIGGFRKRKLQWKRNEIESDNNLRKPA